MKEKHVRLSPRAYIQGAAVILVLLALFTGLYAVRTIRSLQSTLADTQARLAQSEEARISGLYNLERSLGSLRQEGTSDGDPSEENFAEALRAGKIESVLVLGDSISEGCCDTYYIYGQDGREEQGLRQIMTVGENTYYESDPRGQGWVTYFREYLLENTAVTLVHNNSIGGWSAKQFNGCKEEAVSRDYDAIVVMLGTNDRWDCSGPEEFYVEYASLLSYLEGRCKYLQVLTPTPVLDVGYNMDARQVSDVVLELCADRGYACANLYSGLTRYARASGLRLDDIFIGGTHPHHTGYLHLWRLIAEELGLNLEIGSVYDPSQAYDRFSDIGANREEVTEDTRIDAVTQGEYIFPEGISLYFQWEPFAAGTEYGATVITYRYHGGGGKQICKPVYCDYKLSHGYDLVRSVNADGSWGPWSRVKWDSSVPEASESPE